MKHFILVFTVYQDTQLGVSIIKSVNHPYTRSFMKSIGEKLEDHRWRYEYMYNNKKGNIIRKCTNSRLRGPRAQSVGSLIADPGVVSSIPSPILSRRLIIKYFLWSISFCILKNGCLSVTSKSICTEYWFTT